MPEQLSQAKIALSKEQKIGFILLSFFAILAIGLGALQIRNTMYEPFALNEEVPSTIKDLVNSSEALHFRDTDLDGLNDFDELYVYSTSPYLADTDSDGIPDKSEIDQGKNPTCAEDKNCSDSVYNPGTILVNGFGTTTVSTPDPGAPPADINAMLSDPVQIREMLRGVGVDEKVLASFSDADLVEAMKEMMGTTTLMTEQLQNNFNTSTTIVP